MGEGLGCRELGFYYNGQSPGCTGHDSKEEVVKFWNIVEKTLSVLKETVDVQDRRLGYMK